MGPVSRVVTGLATRQVARSVGGASAGPVGMALGLALPMVVRTLGPMGMVGLVVGGWAVKKVLERRAVQGPAPVVVTGQPMVTTQPVSVMADASGAGRPRK